MPWSERWPRAVVAAALLAIAGIGVGYLWSRLSFPYLLVISEDGMYMTARAFQQGWDPWAPDKVVFYSNAYGWLFPWLGAKFSALLPGVSLLRALRLFSALCALGALGWVYRLLRRTAVERLVAAACVVAVGAGWLFYDSITIRPDALLLFCYWGAFSLSQERRPWAPWAAGALAVVGAFAKAYALLAAPMVVALMFLQGRRKEALFALLSSALAAVLMLAWTMALSPHYLEATMAQLASDPRFALSHLFHQNRVLLGLHTGLLAAGLGLLRWRRRQGKPAWVAGPWLPWACIAAGVWAVMGVGLGGHLGAYLRYYLQIFIPLALISYTLWAFQHGLPAVLLAALLALDAGIMLRYDLRAHPWTPLSAEAQADWKKAEALVEAFPGGAYPPVMTSLADAHGPLAAPSEHSRHMLDVEAKTPYLKDLRAQVAALADRIKHGQVGAVVTGWAPELEGYGYRLSDRLVLDTPLTTAAERGYLAVYLRDPGAADKALSKSRPASSGKPLKTF